jgi:hypothetical protein
MRGLALLVLVAGAGCFNPSPPEGLPCADGLCPGDLMCDRGVCVSQPGTVDGPIGGDDAAVDASATGCVCTGDTLTCGSEPSTDCALGCLSAGGAHCGELVPSNAVDRTLVTGTSDVTFAAGTDSTVDVDTGSITGGGFTRTAGTGISDGVGYFRIDGPPGAPDLAIFTFGSLAVEATATVMLTGTRATVVLVAGPVSIAGTVDASADTVARATGGPGGGDGGAMMIAATGCGPGGPGVKLPGMVGDSGAGGGGGGAVGGAGGASDNPSIPGGAGGSQCQPALLEPLIGGSGGGAGSPGMTTVFARGGGGGGALQITSLTQIDLTGTVIASGQGGSGGPMGVANDAGSAGGGGSGGGILVEAPTVSLGPMHALAVNGGGGGGGGGSGVGGNGQPGQSGSAAALGGTVGGTSAGVGGKGGAPTIAAAAGGVNANGGGGGGSIGVVALHVRMLTGTAGPATNTTDIVVE